MSLKKGNHTLLHSVRLVNFRNYTEKVFTFDAGINPICGKNGIGKTNLLEAIYLLSTGRSFRTSKLEELIQWGKPFFFVEATFTKDDIKHTLSIGYDKTQRKILYDGAKIATFAELLGYLPAVLHAPQDIALVSGMPTTRRRFLNIHLAQISPTYLHHLTRYTQALKHRNALLKEGITTSIEIWEREMVQSAEPLMSTRKEALAHFSEEISPIAGRLSSGNEHFSLRYVPCPGSDFAKFLEEHRDKDLIMGATTKGPHRDDFTINMEKALAKSFSSEGQKHSFIAAIKIAEWDRLRLKKEAPPLMLIDDMAAHMDPSRKERFLSEIENIPQVIYTSPK